MESNTKGNLTAGLRLISCNNRTVGGDCSHDTDSLYISRPLFTVSDINETMGEIFAKRENGCQVCGLKEKRGFNEMGWEVLY